MPDNAEPAAVREAVGVFDDAKAFEEAIDELLSSGFDRAQLSLLASETTVEAKLGHRYRKSREAEDDPAAPRVAYVSTEARGDAEGGLIGGLIYVGALAAAGAAVASGGTLAGAVAAAALMGGAGGMIGSALARFIEDHHADYIQEQLVRGGLLLWVNCPDAMHEGRAMGILARHSAHDVHVHNVPVAG